MSLPDSNIFGLNQLPAGANPAKLWSIIYWEEGPDGSYKVQGNNGEAYSNTTRGTIKIVEFLDSRLPGVSATATTLDRLEPSSLVQYGEAWVINPSRTPLISPLPAARYQLLPAAAGSAGAVAAFVDAGPSTTATIPVAWQACPPVFTPITQAELLPDSANIAGLELRPAILELANRATGGPPPVRLPAPTGLTLVQSGTTTAVLNWANTPNNSGYTIEYSASSTFAAGVMLAQVSSSTTTTTLLGLTPGVTYYARMIAKGTGGYLDSVYSAVVSVAIPGSAIPAPLNPQVDDVNNIFSADIVPGYNALANYRFSLDGGSTYANATTAGSLAGGRVSIAIGNANRGVGQVLLAVDPNGTPVSNAQAFTTVGGGGQNLYIGTGNSQTRGGTPEPGDNSYPAQLAPLLPAGWDVINAGNNGANWTDLLGLINTQIRPHIDFSIYTRIVVGCQEFTNDFATRGPLDSFQACRDYIQAIQTIDPRIEMGVFTGYPRYDANQPSAYDGFNTAMLSVNTKLREDWAIMPIKWVFDIRSSQYLDTPSSAQNQAILYDGTHGTAALNRVAAHLVADAIFQPAGIIASTYVLTTPVVPTIGGVPHGTMQVVPYNPGPTVISTIGAWVDRGDIIYDFEATCGYLITYTEGIELFWGAGFTGLTIDCYKDGYTASPTLAGVVTAANTTFYADYPTDGRAHSVLVTKPSIPANAGMPHIFWGARRWVA